MKKFLPKSFNNPRGFTLVELMVVVAIIGILSQIALSIFNGAQSKARDGKRRGDIDALLKALEVNKTATYQPLNGSQFAQGAVPTDPSTNRTAQYCILSRTDTATPEKPTGWLPGSLCPTTTDTVGSAKTGVPLNDTTNFLVCSLLENGSNPDNIYCISNQQ